MSSRPLEPTPQLNALSGLMMDALFDAEAMEKALATLADWCDAPISELLISDHQPTVLKSSLWGPLSDETSELEAAYHPINPRAHALINAPVGRTLRDKDVIDYDEMKTNPAYQEFIIPVGAGHFGAVVLDKTSDRYVIFGLHRAISEDPFSDEAASRLEAAAAACKPAFDLARRIDRRQARTALELLGADACAALLDDRSRVLQSTEAFEQILQAGHARIRADRTLSLPAAEEALGRTLREASSGRSERFAVRLNGQAASWIGEVLPVPSLAFGEAFGGAVILLLEPVAPARPLDCDLVQDAFSLTGAETRVAAGLADGLSINQIAAAQRVAPSTVRTHLKHIMSKTLCARQAELVAKLSVFRRRGRGAG